MTILAKLWSAEGLQQDNTKYEVREVYTQYIKTTPFGHQIIVASDDDDRLASGEWQIHGYGVADEVLAFGDSVMDLVCHAEIAEIDRYRIFHAGTDVVVFDSEVGQ